MIVLTVDPLKEGGTRPFLMINGHAGFSAKGDDIVCSAVSVLVFTFLNSAQVIAGSAVKVNDSGEFKVFISKIDDTKAFEIVVQVFLIGIRSIEEQYPENVKLRILDEE